VAEHYVPPRQHDRDDYLGRPNKPTSSPSLHRPRDGHGLRNAIETAIGIARKAIETNPRDVDAHYQLGAAVGLRASYTATVEGSVPGAFRRAKRMLNTKRSCRWRRNGRMPVSSSAPTGISRDAVPAGPVVASPRIRRWSRARYQLVEEAVSYAGENQTDARFALMLLCNREKRYDDALKQLAALREAYPRNRLVWLENGSTLLRAGRPADALRILNDGFARFADDRRPRMFGELALWHYKRGAALTALGRAEAAAELKEAIANEGRRWVHGRAHVELGKLASGGHRARRARNSGRPFRCARAIMTRRGPMKRNA
jgi:hypothetical protein